MMRTLNLLLIALMLIGAAVVYDFKYEAERATAKVAKIARRIDAERDAIATLKAEWSLLNQPRRLQDLAERYHSYLELDPLAPTQIGTIDDIPFKQATAGDAPLPTPKASVKLGQPEKPTERSPSVGKLLDRLPSGRGDGPTTTGSVAKPHAAPAPASQAPMQLVPRILIPRTGDPSPKSTR